MVALDAITASEELDSVLDALTNGVIGFERMYETHVSVRAQYTLSFSCEHDLVIEVVFPFEGEPFAVEDYGYFPDDEVRPYQRRNSIMNGLTPTDIHNLATENRRYPHNGKRTDFTQQDNVNRQVVELVLAFLTTYETVS